jgi:thymidine phosphorylase
MLEAFDVIAVLENTSQAPDDLRESALLLSAKILETTGLYSKEKSLILARKTLIEGKALEKFNQICLLQGGIKPLYLAKNQHPVLSKSKGIIISIDNRRLARLAKLSGAPKSLAAGIKMNCKLNQSINPGDWLFTLYSESKGELSYALDYLKSNPSIINIGQES